MILSLSSTSQREIPLVRGLENSWANILLSDVRNDMEEGTWKRVHGRGCLKPQVGFMLDWVRTF